MGLKKDLTIYDDVTITGAYFKIKTTVMEWEVGQVKFQLGVWKSRAASKNGRQELPFDQKDIILDVPAGAEGGTKAEQYQMLKAMVPFFADAQDVLET